MGENVKEVDFRALFEASPALYLVLLPDFTIVGGTDAYLRATKVQRENAMGRNLFDVFPDNPDDPKATGVQQLRASLQRVLKNKSDDAMAIQKYDIRRPEEEGGGFEERHWSPHNYPVLNARNEIQYIIHRVEDVTEFVRLKLAGYEAHRASEELKSERDHLEKLRQSQRMEAMGQLAGGVAHDFNNILGAITMICEYALTHDGLPSETGESLQQVLKISERAATLTRQLLAFSRKQVLQPVPLNLNSVIKDISPLLQRLLGERLTLQTEMAADLRNALIDAGQVEQVIMNLALNARDAMPNGGRIVISTSNVELDKSMASGNLEVDPGSYVMLAVRDYGTGMTAKTQARIFEPFFTTKGVGKGTGLGLATVYGIVKQNKGTIWVYSELNKGTVFKVYFPITQQRILPKTETPTPLPQTHPGAKNILIVEDEDQLRDAVCGALRRNKYNVYSARNGLEALNFLKSKQVEVDLIVSDIVMPEMGGQALAKSLVELGYHFKILFLSGYTEEVLNEQGFSEVTPEFLEKPFGVRELLLKVEALLAKP